tara:strand:+ start:1785 stop:2012 length:228 start_codon:yes stop_codon:yes gene_type:complete
MAKKGKARRKKATKRARKKKTDAIKFEVFLDSTYGLSRTELKNTARSLGASKRKSRSIARKIRPKTKKEKRRNRY